MVVLRYILGALVVAMSLARLRIILVLLQATDTYKIRDTLTYYLMAKAISLGESPYQPLNVMALRYFGITQFMPHPAPCTPFLAVMSVPLLVFPVEKAYIAWFCFEMLCLLFIASMLPVLIKGKYDWKLSTLFFLILLGWYPVMVDLLNGQLTLLLTGILVIALLAWRKDKRILTGALIGLTIAIKMYTWPLLLYYAIKRDWKTFLSGCITTAGLNIFALGVIGWGPFTDYYLHVTMQVSAVYHARLKNYSLWSIGYRLFEGAGLNSGDSINVKPLLDLPRLAPYVSAAIAGLFLVAGILWAIKTKDKAIAFSILLCTALLVSPITWDHYYLMLIICLVILGSQLSRQDFPPWSTVTFAVITFMLFVFNEYISEVIFSLNGGVALVQANGNAISFASSLLETLPMVEVVLLTILLWRMGSAKYRLVSAAEALGIQPARAG